ncbi:DUF6545 domain-containing protein [Sinomonas atrocyanea]
MGISGAFLSGSALVRIWLTARNPTAWRVALTAAIAFLAAAIDVNADIRVVDALTTANFSHLAVHVLMSASAGSVMIYVALLNTDRLSQWQLIVYGGGTVLVCVALTLGWMEAKLPVHTVDDLAPWAREPMFAMHEGVFYGWLIACLSLTAVFCFRNARSSDGDITRLIGLSLIGTGCASGAVLFAGFMYSNLVTFFAGVYPHEINDTVTLLSPFALLILTGGLLTMVVVPRLEPDLRAIRRLRRLRSLHEYLVGRHPEVHLARRGWGLRQREQRAVIEIHDALTRLRIHPRTGGDVTSVARSLLCPVDHGIPAADLIDLDDNDLALLADAFTATERS